MDRCWTQQGLLCLYMLCHSKDCGKSYSSKRQLEMLGALYASYNEATSFLAATLSTISATREGLLLWLKCPYQSEVELFSVASWPSATAT